MKMRGQYIITVEGQPPVIVCNTLTTEGLVKWLQVLFNSSAMGSFYIGLTSAVADSGDTLVEAVIGEPTVTNGYARKALARNATDFPTITTQNGEAVLVSKQLDFVASGGDFEKSINRLFLCDASSGTAGLLFSYSAPFSNSVLIANGTTFSVQYQLFLN